jgi:hypothetical protein
LRSDPRLVAAQLAREDLGDARGQLDGGAGVDDQRPRAAGEHVVHGAGHHGVRGEAHVHARQIERRVQRARGGDGGGVEAERRVLGPARAGIEPGVLRGGVHHVLRHPAVGRPLAPGDGDEARARGEDGVLARDPRRPPARGRRTDDGERADPREDRAQVGARGRRVEVAGEGLEDEVDLRGRGRGLEVGGVGWLVGRPRDDHALERDGEQHAPVGRLGHDERVVAREELAGEHDVRAARGADDRLGAGLVHPADRVGERAGGVDDGAGPDLEALAGLGVAGDDAGDGAVLALEQRLDGAVVDDDAVVPGGGAGEGEAEAGVVEAGVGVGHAAADAGGANAREACAGVGAGQALGGLDDAPAGEVVVDPQADGVPRGLERVAGGDDEPEGRDEPGGVPEHQGALAEGLADEGDAALAEIADPAVDELGGA